MSGPALAEAELLTHSQHADTGPGVSLGRTQASPSGHPPIVMMGQSQSLGRGTVDSSIVECQTSASNIPLKIIDSLLLSFSLSLIC